MNVAPISETQLTFDDYLRRLEDAEVAAATADKTIGQPLNSDSEDNAFHLSIRTLESEPELATTLDNIFGERCKTLNWLTQPAYNQIRPILQLAVDRPVFDKLVTTLLSKSTN